MEDAPDYSRILNLISNCHDLDKLRGFVTNAARKNVVEVRDTALKQINTMIPQKAPGSFEAAFWNMFEIYHTYLLLHNRPVRRLSKTWNYAIEEGEIATLIHWIGNGEQSWALQKFIELDETENTAEKLVLKYPKRFDEIIKEQAKRNLKAAVSA